MHVYAHHGVIDGVHGPVADIHQICLLDRDKCFLQESLFHYRHLTEQAHFLGVRDTHIGFRVGGRAVRNDDRTRVSRLYESSGRNMCVLYLSKH